MHLRILCLSSLLGLAGAAQAQDIHFRLPLACEVGRSCFVQHYVDRDPTPAAHDYQCGTLTYDGHDGTDIRIPTLAEERRGVDVLAAADGTVLRTRDGVPDISVAVPGQRDKIKNAECGNGAVIDHGNGWQTQYCHMAQGSLAVKPGDSVKAGDRIGKAGLSGDTEFPHLHFTVRKDNAVVDPFAFGAAKDSCGGGTSLWDAKTAQALAYRPSVVLNKGFTSGPVTMEDIESGAAGRQTPDMKAPALVAYVRAIGLKERDVQSLTLFGPDGKVLADNRTEPLDHDKAQWMAFTGVKRPASGWTSGLYRAIYRVIRDGKPALELAFGFDLRP